jgi:hypothetical protein
MAIIGTDILSLPTVTGLDGTEYYPLVQGLNSSAVTKRAQGSMIVQSGVAAGLPASMEFIIDGGGANISGRTWGYLTVPFNATITQAELFADTVGSIIVNVWRCTYAQFDAGITHPKAADSITGSTPPTISNSTKSQDSTLTGWLTSLTVGDVLAFNVPVAATNITRVTLTLNMNRFLST